MRKRIISISLVMCMLFTMVPTAAFAAVKETFTIDNLTYTVTKEDPEGQEVSVKAKDTEISGSIIIPETVQNGGKTYKVTDVEMMAFFNCKSITDVKIGDNVYTVKYMAFSYCTQLQTLTLGKSVKSFYGELVNGCTALTEINADIQNTFLSSENGVLFSKNSDGGKIIYKYPANKQGNSYAIPNDVAEVSSCAFNENQNLESIDIPDSVTKIGSYSFGNMKSIKALTIPKNVSELSVEMCDKSYALTDINVDSENAYYSSEDGVLLNKEKTELIKYPCGKTNESYAIPNSVTTVGSNSFYSVKTVKNLILHDGITEVNTEAFNNISGVKTLKINANKDVTIGIFNTYRTFNNITIAYINAGIPFTVINTSLKEITVTNKSETNIIVNGVSVGDGTYTAAPAKAKAPTFNPAGGEFTKASHTVTISTATEGAEIYYTTDGTVPTKSSTRYENPLTIAETMTIKAVAVKEGMIDSDIGSASYTKSAGTAVTTFEELKTALANAQSGGKITLGGNITASESITINKDITLDLNNNILTMGTNKINVTAGNFTIEDSGTNGKITGSINTIVNESRGTVTVNGGTVSATGDNGIAIDNNGTVTVNGGTVSAMGANGTAIYNKTNGKVEVKGGTVSSAGADGISIYNSAVNGKVEVNGGTVSSAGMSGIAIYNFGTVIVNVGTVSATTGSAIYNNSTGKITISQAEGKTTLVTSANTNNAQGTIVLNKVPQAESKVLLEITGGTVSNTGTTEGYSVCFASDFNSGNINDYYSKADGANVGKINIVIHKIVTTFEELKTALANAQADDTIKLDGIVIEANGDITIDTAITLDLNGNILAMGSHSITVTEKGNLTITDSTEGQTGKIKGGGVIDSGNTIGIKRADAINNKGTLMVTGGTVYGGEGTAVNNSGTVMVTEGTVSAEGGGTAVNNSGTVTVSGGAVSATGATGKAIYNNGTGTLTVSGGAVSATGTESAKNKCSAIINIGMLTVTGGTVSATGYRGNTIYNFGTGTVTVTGGTVSATKGSAIRNESTGKITIEEAEGATTTITSANTTSKEGTIYIGAKPTSADIVLKITGGTVANTGEPQGYSVYFASDFNSGNINDYYSKADGANVGKINIVIHKIVTTFEELKTALANAQAGGKITLGGNITASESITINKDITLDLKGKILTMEADKYVNVTAGNFTIEDSGTTGKITGSTNTIVNESRGTVTVNGGTVSAIESLGKAIYNNGTVTVDGGEVSSKNGTAIYNNGTGKITISQAEGKTTLVTSANTNNAQGTIVLNKVPQAESKVLLEITGGTVSNTGEPQGYSVYFASDFNSGNINDYYTHSGGSVGKTNVLKINAAAPIISKDLSTEKIEYVVGDSANELEVEASVTDKGTLSYQWHVNNTNSTSGGTAIENAISTGFTPPTQFIGTKYYYCVVTSTIADNDDGGKKNAAVSSKAAMITVIARKETTPSAEFTAAGSDSGRLTNAASGMKYSIDGGLTWVDITSTTAAIASGITTANGIQVVKKGDGASTIDSEAQKITVTKANAPTGVDKTDETSALNDGKITGVTTAMEYRKSTDSSWTSCTATTVTGLVGTTYDVRIKASGAVLASDSVRVTIKKFVKATPTKDDLEFALTAVDYDESAKNVSVTAKDGKSLGAITVKYNGLTAKPINAGTYSITVDIAENAEYNAVTALSLGDFTINKADYKGTKTISDTVFTKGEQNATVLLPKLPEGASYGSPLTSGMVTMSDISIKGETLTYTAPKSTADKTGIITIPVKNADNYKDFSVVLTVAYVEKTPQDISYANVSISKTYGDEKFINPLTQITVKGSVSYESDDSTVAAVNPLTGEVTIIGYGTDGNATITATANETDTHEKATASYVVTVSKKALTLKADDKYMTKGGALPAFTYTQTGLVNGDKVITPPSLQADTDGNTAGTFAIVVSGGKISNFDNYNIIYANGKLTVSEESGGGSSYEESYYDKGNITVIMPPKDKPNSPIKGQIELSAKVDASGNAIINITSQEVIDACNKIFAEAAKTGNESNDMSLVMQVSPNNPITGTLSVNMQKKAQELIIEKNIAQTLVIMGDSNVQIAINQLAMKAIYTQAQGDVNIEILKVDNSKMTKNAQAAIGSRPAFDFRATYNGGKQIESFGNGRVAVGIPYTLKANESQKNIYGVYSNELGAGKLEWLSSSLYDEITKMLYFDIPHLSVYGVGCKEVKADFTDVESHWAKESIEYVVNRGLFGGTDNASFSPNTDMTRGMFVTVLGRLAQANVNEYKASSFSDVSSSAYYMGYVEWASKNNIVNGIGNGKFAPDMPITREQMAVIMANYAVKIGFNMPKTAAENAFADIAQISSYAESAVKQMQMAGVLSGKDGNRFDPQGVATRAESAAVLRRFAELIYGIDARQGLAK